MTLADVATLAAGAMGDAAAVGMGLDEFLHSVERRAFQMAVMATRDRDEALDLVQDAMTSLVSRYAGRPAGEWRPLFYRILHNAIMDWHRRGQVRARRQLALDADAGNEMIATVPDPREPGQDQRLQQQQALTAVERAVAALPDRQRQALLLRSWEGLSVAETAAVMGCTEGSVKTHYFRAMQCLKDIAEEYL